MKVLFVLMAVALTTMSHAVSFDCTKAGTFVEKAICADPLLSKLDDALSENYRYMLASDIGDGARKHLRDTQVKWLGERNKCINNNCLVEAYRQRVDKICDYPVISGVHPVCTRAEDIKNGSQQPISAALQKPSIIAKSSGNISSFVCATDTTLNRHFFFGDGVYLMQNFIRFEGKTTPMLWLVGNYTKSGNNYEVLHRAEYSVASDTIRDLQRNDEVTSTSRTQWAAAKRQIKISYEIKMLEKNEVSMSQIGREINGQRERASGALGKCVEDSTSESRTQAQGVRGLVPSRFIAQ